MVVVTDPDLLDRTGDEGTDAEGLHRLHGPGGIDDGLDLAGADGDRRELGLRLVPEVALPIEPRGQDADGDDAEDDDPLD
jgi:hypothetical protein